MQYILCQCCGCLLKVVFLLELTLCVSVLPVYVSCVLTHSGIGSGVTFQCKNDNGLRGTDNINCYSVYYNKNERSVNHAHTHACTHAHTHTHAHTYTCMYTLYEFIYSSHGIPV